jgi:hypothetical protein
MLFSREPSELLLSGGIQHSLSIIFSYFHLLLGNHWANVNQTWQEWTLGGPHAAQNLKKA